MVCMLEIYPSPTTTHFNACILSMILFSLSILTQSPKEHELHLNLKTNTNMKITIRHDKVIL